MKESSDESSHREIVEERLCFDLHCRVNDARRQSVGENPWSFGVLSDTQWTVTDSEGQSPNTIPANLMGQIDQQFIQKGVKLVVDIGDSVDTSSTANLDARALYVQDLYNAGIAYYPLRGNHEAGDGNSGAEFSRTYPADRLYGQPDRLTGGTTGTAGLNNATPCDIVAKTGVGVDTNIAPPVKTNPNTFTVGSNFSYPTAVNNANGAVSYSFDYNNTRFVLLDQFDTTGNTNDSTIAQQQPWITRQLSTRQDQRHADLRLRPQEPARRKPQGQPLRPANRLQRSRRRQRRRLGLADPRPADPTAGQAERRKRLHRRHGQQQCQVLHLRPRPPRLQFRRDQPGRHGQRASDHQPVRFLEVLHARRPVLGQRHSGPQQLNQVGYYIYTIDGPRVTVDYYAAPANTVDSQGLTITQGGNPDLQLHQAADLRLQPQRQGVPGEVRRKPERRSGQLRRHQYVAGRFQRQRRQDRRRSAR